jgi:hypothetical protein
MTKHTSNLDRAVVAVSNRITRLSKVPCTTDTRAELTELLQKEEKYRSAIVAEFNRNPLSSRCDDYTLEAKLRRAIEKAEKILSTTTEP